MLINDIETLKIYIPTITGDDFDLYSHHLELAEEWLEKEIIGDELYVFVKVPADNDVLVKKCQAVVAHKAYYTAIPFLDLIQTNNGFAVASDNNIAPASQQRVAALSKAVESALAERVDRMLEFLEKTTKYHDAWKDSQTYSLLYDTYLFTLTEFNRYAQFPGNRLDFKSAKAKMLIIIAQKIETIISPELSDQLIAQLQDNEVAEGNKKILESIRFAFANYTIGNDCLADNFIAKVRGMLMKNPTAFPAYNTSELYATILASTPFKTDGSPFLVCGS